MLQLVISRRERGQALTVFQLFEDNVLKFRQFGRLLQYLGSYAAILLTFLNLWRLNAVEVKDIHARFPYKGLHLFLSHFARVKRRYGRNDRAWLLNFNRQSRFLNFLR